MSNSMLLEDIAVRIEGATQPPRDMMEAARMSLSPEGFAYLMQQTGGRAPTSSELVAIADAERLATSAIKGAVDAAVGQLATLFSGEVQGGRVSRAAPLVGERGPELFVPRANPP